MVGAVRTVWAVQLWLWAIAVGFDGCPLGWWSMGDEQCVQAQLRSATAREARSSCASAGARLVEVVVDPETGTTLLEDLGHLLNSLHSKGVQELTWLVGDNADIWKRSRMDYKLWMGTWPVKSEVVALQRRPNASLAIVTVPVHSSHPFICSLTPLMRRKLIYEQLLLPKGAPMIVEHPDTNYHYAQRPERLYLALPCKAIGDPTPVIRWFRNGVEEVDISSSNLIIASGSLLLPVGHNESDETASGSYHCTASNSLGVVRSSSSLVRAAFISAFRAQRLDIFADSADGLRIDCEAPHHYPKSHSFAWLQSHSTDRFVAQSERVFISHDGSLLFSYSITADHTSYACSLAISSTASGHYGPFFNLVFAIDVELPPKEFPPRMDVFFPQIFPEEPKTNTAVYLECFAYGRPSPTYSWSRVDGRILSRGSKTLNHGRVMKIESAEMDDAGQYRCTATNHLGSVQAEVMLILQAGPSFIQPLYDSLTSTDDTKHFECQLAPGDSMSSSIEWFHDGMPLSPLLMPDNMRHRFHVENNSGIYQCIVSKDIGSAVSSALLTVSDFAPKFDGNFMPRRIFAVIGTDITVPCVFHSSPIGKAHWLHAGGVIETNGGGRLKQLEENNSLRIAEVRDEDHGVYVCIAENRLGTASRELQLVVLGKPQVRVNPNQAYLPKQDSVNFSCEVEIACSQNEFCPEALFDWTFNERPSRSVKHKALARITEEAQVAPRSMNKNSAKVLQKLRVELPASLGRQRVGRFSCTSLYGGGQADIETHPVPPTPIELKVLDLRPDSVRLAWRQPPPRDREQRDNKIAIDAYRVEYRTVNNRHWRPAPDGLLFTGDDLVASFLVSTLNPNQQYQFRVRSRGGGGFSRPSAPTIWQITPPTHPTSIVKNIRTTSITHDILLIEWDPLETVKANGPNLHYKVHWSDGPGDDHEYSANTSLPEYVIQLNESESSCRMIVFSIQSVNDLGPGPTSIDYNAYLSTEAPTRRAKELIARPINATHLNISWQWADKSNCENVYGSMISCLNESDASIIVNESVPIDYQWWTLGGLVGFAHFRCFITAFDLNGRFGRASENLTVEMPMAPPYHIPIIRSVKLKLTDNGHTTLVQWTAIPLIERGMNASPTEYGYRLFLTISETANSSLVFDMRESELRDRLNPSAHINGLRVMHFYTLSIAGFNEGGIGPLSDPMSFRLGIGDTQLFAGALCRLRISDRIFFLTLITFWIFMYLS